jgi:hypothetical protein
MLDDDVLRLISLELSPHKLSVCKRLHCMYNDSWYEDKLKILNPDKTLFIQTNFKDLYTKYSKQGTIFYIEEGSTTALCTKGTKASILDVPYVLNFNGELYCDDSLELVDTEVIDLYHCSYIKEYEWYIIKDGINIKLDILPTKPFIKIIYYILIYALTEDGVYYYGNSISFFPLKGCKDMYLDDFFLYVLDDNNVTHYLDIISHMVIERDDDIKVIYDKGIFDSSYNPVCFNIDYGKSHQIKFEPGLYSPSNITKYFSVRGRIIILEKNKMYIYEYDTQIIKKMLCEEDNILDIVESAYCWFFIK